MKRYNVYSISGEKRLISTHNTFDEAYHRAERCYFPTEIAPEEVTPEKADFLDDLAYDHEQDLKDPR